MIIGINGKIGSGKDTVGKIIQRLLYTNKDQSSEIKKFAGKLKQIASLLTSVPVERFEDQDFKQSYLGEQWAKTPVTPLSDATLFDKVDLNNLMTYRELLQKLGTEAMRDGLHTNVWVNALFADYKKDWGIESNLPYSESLNLKYPNWIITDMRFPNELEAVEERKGITIRVVREFYQFVDTVHEWSDREDRQGNVLRANATYSKEESNRVWRAFLKERAHASEVALDDAKFDYEIINDGTIKDLEEKVKDILVKEKLISYVKS